MQIHEISQTSSINEAMFSDMLTAIFTKDPKLAGMNLAQKAQAISNNQAVNQISNQAYSGWLQKHMQLMKVNRNQPLARNQYEDELKAYVEDLLLPRNVDYDTLTVKNQLDTAIKTMAYYASDPKKNKESFDRIVDLATVARADPALQAQLRAQGSRAQTPSASAPAGSAQQSSRAVQTFLTQSMSRQQQQVLAQFIQQASGGAVRSTGNPQIDALLNVLGVTTR